MGALGTQHGPWKVEGTTELLSSLHKSGMSFSLIAARINGEFGTNISRNACIGRAVRLGLDSRKTTLHLPRQPYVRKAPRAPVVKKIKIAIPTVTEIELREVAVNALHVSIVDLDQDQCRYPYGDGPFTFCALPVMESHCYCAAHFSLTHNRTNEPPREKFRVSRFSGHVPVAA